MTHDASRTGAPMVLLRMLEAMDRTEVELKVVALGPGPLLSRFEALAGKVHVLPRALDWRRTPRLVSASPPARRGLASWLTRRARGCDVAYVNTATTGRAVAALRATGLPVVVHVHELHQWLSTRVDPADLESALAAEAIIACSNPVRSVLVDRLSVDPARIRVIHEVPGETEQRSAAEPALRALGLDGAVRIVGGSGTVDQRKGPDLFLSACLPLLRENPDVHAVWMGDRNEPLFAQWVEHDADRMGIASQFHLVGGVDRPADVMQAFDVLALTSREDPYPLVMLEAAALRVPVVAFAGAGGADDFLAEGRGTLVPYGDIAALSQALRQVLEAPEEEQLDRAQAYADLHQPAAAAAEVVETMRSVLSPI